MKLSHVGFFEDHDSFSTRDKLHLQNSSFCCVTKTQETLKLLLPPMIIKLYNLITAHKIMKETGTASFNRKGRSRFLPEEILYCPVPQVSLSRLISFGRKHSNLGSSLHTSGFSMERKLVIHQSNAKPEEFWLGFTLFSNLGKFWQLRSWKASTYLYHICKTIQLLLDCKVDAPLLPYNLEN